MVVRSHILYESSVVSEGSGRDGIQNEGFIIVISLLFLWSMIGGKDARK